MPSDSTQDIGRPFIASGSHGRPGLLASFARRLHARARKAPPQADNKNPANAIRLVCISDTHNTKPSLPDGDVLLHAGDLSQYGTFDEVQGQLDWLAAQPHPVKVVIAGNHDLILDEAFVAAHPDRELDRPGKSYTDLNWGGVTYLRDESLVVDCKGRKLSIYGSPWTPRCGNFAFQYDATVDFWAGKVPDNTDIFLTHGPPAMHLDQEGKGCPSLLNEMWRARPRLIIFGHIHGGHGEEAVILDDVQRDYEAILLGRAPTSNAIKFMAAVSQRALTTRTRAEGTAQQIHLVNAAVLAGRGEPLNEPMVTYV